MRAHERALQRGPGDPRARRKLLLILAIGLAPVVASYAVYYFWPRDAHVNYGELPPPGARALGGARRRNAVRAGDLRGKWVLVGAAPAAATRPARSKLYATRQARTMQGASRTAWRASGRRAATPRSPPAQLLASIRDSTSCVRRPRPSRRCPPAATGIYLIDPLGNLVLAWPADPDIKALAKDCGRLLRASRIG